jgi:hypothetical protein
MTIAEPYAARGGAAPGALASAARGAAAAGGAVVLGRGSARFGGRGRRAALIRVRLTRRGITLVRRAGGARSVTVRLRTRSVGGRRGALRRRTTLVLPRAYVVGGYEPGQVRPARRQRAALRGIARELAGARRIRCIGHADGSATRSFALRLGLLRASAVCAALARRTHAASFAPLSAGDRRPRATNATRGGRKMNRRVTVQILR